MQDIEQKQNTPPPRLCSEIQLFELCELDSCGYKNGRFCTDEDLLSRFEKIAEDEVGAPQLYIDEEYDHDDEPDEDGFDEYGFTDDDEDDRDYEE